MKFIAMLALASLGLPLPAMADELDDLRSVLTVRMPDLVIGEIRKIPQMDLYEVQANGINLLYVDAHGDYAMFGNLVDLRTQVSLTEERREALRQVDFNTLPLELAFVRVKGDGSRKLAVFADPDCPYCRQLEHELADITDVTIYTFLYPLSDLHPDAARKSTRIWCAPDRARAWEGVLLADSEPPAGETGCEAPLGAIAEIAHKLWINGTPGMVFGNGKLVPGFIARDRIELLLRSPNG